MPPRRVVSRSNAPAPVASTSTSSTPAITASASAALADAKGKARDEASGFVDAVQTLWTNYREQTAPRLKLIDSFMFFLMLTGVLQFIYCFAVTNYPFNAFIGGFAATVGQFVLLGALRIQCNPDNKSTFPSVSPERAFGDFLFGSLILHFFVWNYLG